MGHTLGGRMLVITHHYDKNHLDYDDNHHDDKEVLLQKRMTNVMFYQLLIFVIFRWFSSSWHRLCQCSSISTTHALWRKYNDFINIRRIEVMND